MTGDVNSGKLPLFQGNLPLSTMMPPIECAVAADELRQRVHDDIRAVLDGPGYKGRGKRIIDDERHAVIVRDFGDRLDIQDIAARIADCFSVQQLWFWA